MVKAPLAPLLVNKGIKEFMAKKSKIVFEKYQYSIITVCEAVHGAFTGRGDPLPEEILIEYYAWLNWRLGDGWDKGLDSKWLSYDLGVRDLGFKVLNEFRKRGY